MKLESTWYVSFKCPTGILIIIITITIIVIFIIIIVIIIITYVWVKGTQEQVPQSNLSNNEDRSKKCKYFILNGNISPENNGMDMMVLKFIEGYNESSKVSLPLDIKREINI